MNTLDITTIEDDSVNKKIKQDICIGANIRAIRENKGIKPRGDKWKRISTGILCHAA